MTYAIKPLENIILNLNKGAFSSAKEAFQSFPNMDLCAGWPLGLSTSSYFLSESYVLESLAFGETRIYQDIQTMMVSGPKE